MFKDGYIDALNIFPIKSWKFYFRKYREREFGVQPLENPLPSIEVLATCKTCLLNPLMSSLSWSFALSCCS